MVLYSDTSALSKRYVLETGSAWLSALVDPVTDNDVYTVILTAALTRRERGRSLTPEAAADLDTDYQTVQVDDALINSAMRLAEKHALRGYDAVQLAAGAETKRMGESPAVTYSLFVSADTELNAAARAVCASGQPPRTAGEPVAVGRASVALRGLARMRRLCGGLWERPLP